MLLLVGSEVISRATIAAVAVAHEDYLGLVGNGISIEDSSTWSSRLKANIALACKLRRWPKNSSTECCGC